MMESGNIKYKRNVKINSARFNTIYRGMESRRKMSSFLAKGRKSPTRARGFPPFVVHPCFQAIQKNMADLQYFGSMQTAQGDVNIMLSIDEDIPTAGMLTCFGTPAFPAMGAEVSIKRNYHEWKITIRNVYRQANDRVFRAVLNPDEQARVSNAWASLQPAIGTAPEAPIQLIGEWFDPRDGQRRRMSLYPASMAESVKAYTCQNWEDFKSWAQRVHDAGAVAFRGQASSAWRLETSLHRAGRTNLLRYRNETLQEFHSHLEATGLHIDFEKPAEFGRMVALAQHYGLPTPLLDWTQSPYIASWFAFSDVLGEKVVKRSDGSTLPQTDFVRIYALTPTFETRFSFASMPALDDLVPFAALAKVTPRDNPRLYAQQGRFVVTNLGNLESYLVHLAKIGQGDMLWAADVSKAETVKAMKDLALMGLSAATLFPGLEGACRTLRHQMAVQSRSAKAEVPLYPLFTSAPPVGQLPLR